MLSSCRVLLLSCGLCWANPWGDNATTATTTPSPQSRGLLHDIRSAHEGKVYGLAFSDGSLLASAGTDHMVNVWNLSDAPVLEPSQRLKGHTAAVTSVTFSPSDWTLLISGGADNTSRVWNTSTGEALAVLAHPKTVFGIAVQPTGGLLATACWDGKVRLYGLPSFRLQAELSGHTGGLYSVAFSPLDPSLLASASADRSVRIWDVSQPDSPRQLWQLQVHGDHVTSVGWSPTEAMTLSSTSWDRKFRLWRISEQEYQTCRIQAGACALKLLPYLTRKHPQLVWRTSFSPDGRQVAACHGAVGQSPTVIVYDVVTGAVLRRLGRHRDTPLMIAWSATNGNMLASAGMDKRVLVYNTSVLADDDVPLGDPDDVEETVQWKLDLQNFLLGTLDRQNESSNDSSSGMMHIPHPMQGHGIIY